MSDSANRGVEAVDLAALAHGGPGRGVPWALQSEDLSANLVVFAAGEGVAAHVNAEVDVLFLGVAGDGVVEVHGRSHHLGPGRLLVVPNGARRATRAVGDRFAYLTCHRRRAGLLPTKRPRPGAPPGADDPAPAP